LVGLGEVEFEDPDANKPRKKQRLDGYNSDTSDASRDFELIYLSEDSEDEEKILNWLLEIQR
jgi:hypothetical protein